MTESEIKEINKDTSSKEKTVYNTGLVADRVSKAVFIEIHKIQKYIELFEKQTSKTNQDVAKRKKIEEEISELKDIIDQFLGRPNKGLEITFTQALTTTRDKITKIKKHLDEHHLTDDFQSEFDTLEMPSDEQILKLLAEKNVASEKLKLKRTFNAKFFKDLQNQIQLSKKHWEKRCLTHIDVLKKTFDELQKIIQKQKDGDQSTINPKSLSDDSKTKGGGNNDSSSENSQSKNSKSTPNISEKTKTFILENNIKFQKQIRKTAKHIYDDILQFLKLYVKKVIYVRNFSKHLKESKELFLKTNNSMERWPYQEHLKVENNSTNDEELSNAIVNEMINTINPIKGVFTKLKKEVASFNETITEVFLGSLPKEEDKDQLLNYFGDTDKVIEKYEKKLISFYSNNISPMDVIIDSNFFSLYVIKVIHFALISLSLFLTEKIFSEMYMKAVYANNLAPPNLLIFLAIFLAIDIALVLFLLTIMFLIKFIVNNNDFLINGDLIKSMLLDYGCFIVLLFIIMAIIASYMQSKKYFRYNTEGLRAVRALQDITRVVSVVLLVVPYFAIF